MKTYTTGQIAKMLSVAPRTVVKWFDSGKIDGYRLPGSLDRRIPATALKDFLKKNNMKITNDHMVFYCVQSTENVKLAKQLTKTVVCLNGYMFGVQVEKLKPEYVIIDINASQSLMIAACVDAKVLLLMRKASQKFEQSSIHAVVRNYEEIIDAIN